MMKQEASSNVATSLWLTEVLLSSNSNQPSSKLSTRTKSAVKRSYSALSPQSQQLLCIPTRACWLLQVLKDSSSFTITYKRVTPKFISSKNIPKIIVRRKPSSLLLKRVKARKAKKRLQKKGRRKRKKSSKETSFSLHSSSPLKEMSS